MKIFGGQLQGMMTDTDTNQAKRWNARQETIVTSTSVCTVQCIGFLKQQTLSSRSSGLYLFTFTIIFRFHSLIQVYTAALTKWKQKYK